MGFIIIKVRSGRVLLKKKLKPAAVVYGFGNLNFVQLWFDNGKLPVGGAHCHPTHNKQLTFQVIFQRIERCR